MEHHASSCPEGRVHFGKWTAGVKPATRRAPKLLVSNCPSSAEKLGIFSAEVGQLLWKGVRLGTEIGTETAARGQELESVLQEEDAVGSGRGRWA